jgi:hypothetical protein
MAKHKSFIHIPLPPAAPSPPPPPAPAPPPAAPAPRLAVQVLTVAGDLIIIAACVLGFVTAGNWLIAGVDPHSGTVRQSPSAPREVWHCWWDQRYGEICQPSYRLPPM